MASNIRWKGRGKRERKAGIHGLIFCRKVCFIGYEVFGRIHIGAIMYM